MANGTNGHVVRDTLSSMGDSVYTWLGTWLSTTKRVVVGDFNATVGTNDCDKWMLGPHGSSPRNDNGMRLIDFLSACRLFLGNSMFEKPSHRRWNWESPNEEVRSEIDHVLVSRRWSLLDVYVLPSFDTDSDHRLVRAKLTVKKKIFKRDTHKSAPLRIPSFSSQELEHAIESYDCKCLEDPSEDYDLLVSGLLRKNTISKACRLAVKESIQAYRRLKLLEAAQKGSSIKRCKRDLCDQKAVMSALMDKDGVTQTSRRAIEAVVQDFYTDSFRSSIPVAKSVMPPAEEAAPILTSEVAYAIRRMKSGTAPGPDGISADLLRAGGSALCSLLTKHFNHYLRLAGRHRQLPTHQSSLGCLQVITSILLNRMERILDDNQPVEQAGFRKNFSCMDQIPVAQLIERSREYHIPLVLVFVDYRKAFDSVEINAVLNALVHAGVPSPYVQLLDECFSNTSTTIQLFDRKLTMPIGKGARQEDPIFPKLFTAALQDAMKNLDWDAKGYPVDGKWISNLRLADDIVLISNSTAEAEEMLGELNMAGRKIGLDMNMSKTQFMVNQWCDTGIVKLNGVALQRADSYVYLGRELNMENDLAPEIARRRRAAWAAFSSIREVTDQVKDAGLRASLFNASVLPAMCYARDRNLA
ncbi:hypothetical protein Q1695_008343 [Nippostrongylus brasiliensis]|nr:hypothetical protein Q1695_008343 [Nippostrongylus brasiliensis]